MARSRVIDGVTYVEVDRVAKVGEKIVVTTKGNGWYDDKIGKVYEVVDGMAYGFDVHELRDIESAVYVENGKNSNSSMSFVNDEHYRVLEPLKPTLSELTSKCTPENRHEEVFIEGTQASPQVEVDERDASPSVVDMLANLARRVTQLESQLAATQRNLETFAEQTESNTQDIAMLDERTYPKEEEEITPDESIPKYYTEMLVKFYERRDR